MSIRDLRILVSGVDFMPERAERARRLADETGGEVVWDTERSNIRTLLDAFRRTEGSAGVFLEDDVRLTSGWRAKIDAAISEHPHVLIQFFSRRKADLTLGSRWDSGGRYMGNQCFYMPPGMAVAAAEWIDGNPHIRSRSPYVNGGADWTLAQFLDKHHQRYWLHVPSLVQHEEWKSAIGPRSTKRQSLSFVP